MINPAPTPKAYIFDVFGTVVDWRNGVATVSQRFFDAKHLSENPWTFAEAWRSKYQPAMEKIRSGNRGYVALDTLHFENLEELLEELGYDDVFNEEEKHELSKAWEQLPPWEDCVPGLSKLKEKAIIAPCSNGSIALMTRLAKFANLPWDCILGAEIAQNYKPHPQAYLRSVEALGLAPQDVMMVAAHNDDLIAARACGLQTAFIARPNEYGPHQTKDLAPESDWNCIVDSICDLADI